MMCSARRMSTCRLRIKRKVGKRKMGLQQYKIAAALLIIDKQ